MDTTHEDHLYRLCMAHSYNARKSTIHVQLHTLKTTGPQKPCTASHTLMQTRQIRSAPARTCFHPCLLYKMWTLHPSEVMQNRGFRYMYKLSRYPLRKHPLGFYHRLDIFPSK